MFIKGRKNRLCRLWSIFSFCVAIYGFGAYIAANSATEASAFTWWQVSHFGVILIPILFFHFIYTFLGYQNKRLINALYLIAAIFLFLDIFLKNLYIGNVSLLFTDSKYFKPAW
ncbi:histidine kinase N-terminal 7TM domain-containing protein, partial [Candidatus Omnitrophota bacterium]